MSAWVWWAVAGAVWTLASIGLGVVIGRVAKARDRQKPVEPQPQVVVQPLDPKVMRALAESIRTNPPSGPRGDKQ